MQSDMTQGLTLPAFDLRSDIRHPYSSSIGYKTVLYPNSRQLLISKREVILIRGSTVTKKLKYDEDIIAASYTSFNSGGSGCDTNPTDALIICLRKSAYINYPDGRSYVVSFPFSLKSALPFESGIILEKDLNVPSLSSIDNLHPQQLHTAKFLTLVDPIGDFRIITSSSTSIISPHERLMTFPAKGLNKTSTICATFNTLEKTVVLYHIRSSARGNKKLVTNSSKLSKRKQSMISTPNPSRIPEDESVHLDPNHNNNSISNNSLQNVISMNMEKKRTSTLLSDVSSIARMSSDPGFPDSSKTKSGYSSLEFAVFRKDMILTKIDAYKLNVDKSQVEVYGLTYEDQEAIVIMNKSSKEAQVHIFQQLSSHIPRYQFCYRIQCEHCIPLNNSKHEGYLVVLKDEHSLTLVNPFIDVVTLNIDLTGNFPPIKMLQSSFNEDVALLSKSGKAYILKLLLDPSNELVLKCLQCFKYLSGSKINETIWVLWRSALLLDERRDDWNAFVITLLSLIYPFQDDFPSGISNEITKMLPKAKHLHSISQFNYSFSDLIPYVVISLHLIREEMKLDILSQSNLNTMGMFLTQLTTWMGWPESWNKYYMIDMNNIEKVTRFLLVCVLGSPPNLLASLTSLFSDSLIPYLFFSQLVEESDTIDELITPRTYHVLKLFEIIVSPHYEPTHVIDMMCTYGITMSDLETYPPGIYIPLKEAVLICQENPAFEWTSRTLELVGRKDLSMFLDTDAFQTPSSHYTGLSGSTSQLVTKDINYILANIFDKNESVVAWDGQSEADRINITKLIFDYDRRYYEITTLLHQTKTQSATLTTDEDISEYDMFILQRELAALVALRTLTIPLGRAALFYAGRMPLLTEKFPIPKFSFSTLIAPTMTNIILSKGAISDNISEWGYFHNGVSSGLSISKDSKGISGSWIIFNKPPELNSQHAGFLLGLGLNGHLKKLEEWHIYNYLGPKHPLTSVGLLVGMAASIKGSMDNKLTKVLSVHAVALLPQGANDLNVPIMVQTAGLIGIGLLYLESQHRRMSEILLSQITSSVFQNDTEQIHEGYRLAAGIALGFVNLGKGNDLRGLNDTHVIDKLLVLAISMKDFQSIQELDKSCCGAIIALGFIYMKTENIAIANKLEVPNNEQLLDYIRPDLLLLRCVAKNLIMWEFIDNSIEWVNNEIPRPLLEKYSLDSIDSLDSDQLGYFNILGGACLSIAIKYASTHDKKARDTLLYFLDKMMVISVAPVNNYDQRMAYHCANNTQDLIALSLSIIMAGSGDLETFRRLRILQGETNKDMGYGNYMAINTALGFLFLGGGQYAFSKSNFAIASLVVSLYPIYPNENSEYEVHLQALRHFWALSVEPRCLIIRDVNTRKPCKVPVTITMKNGEVKETLSPYLLPNLSDILMISTNSPDHFNVQIDFQLNSEYLEIFKKTLTIFVYKRRNYQLLKTSIGTLLKNENKKLQIDNGEVSINSDVSKLLGLKFMEKLNTFEKQIFLYESSDNDGEYDSLTNNSGLSIFNIIDNKIEMQLMATKPKTIDDLWNLKLIFAFTDRLLTENLHFISLGFIEQLKQNVWKLSNS